MNRSFSYQRLYFVGIGGIGMSALARFFHQQGFDIAGYDRVSSELTQELEKEGMDIHYSDSTNLIPEAYRDTEGTLVVYTPAVPSDHPELTFFRDHNFRMVKRSGLLGMVSERGKSIAVAGTHGKTSISTLIAHILTVAGKNGAAFLGGISNNYHTNVLSGKGEWIVLEADEFDRSFLRLFPDFAVISAMDADHLDIYGTKEELIDAFYQFASQINEGGRLLVREGLAINRCVNRQVIWFTYGLGKKADYSPQRLVEEKGYYRFDIKTPTQVIEDVRLGIPGLINVENAVAAVAIAEMVGTEAHDIRKALLLYKGVKRRFDIRIQGEKYIYIDDYAHHPNEIASTLVSVRNMFPGKKIGVIFQPHLYSRTADFADEFATSLDRFDTVFLLDIYPAREEPIAGVDAGIIMDKMKLREKRRISKEEVIPLLHKDPPEVLLTMGAGDIDRLVEPIEELYGKLQDE